MLLTSENATLAALGFSSGWEGPRVKTLDIDLKITGDQDNRKGIDGMAQRFLSQISRMARPKQPCTFNNNASIFPLNFIPWTPCTSISLTRFKLGLGLRLLED